MLELFPEMVLRRKRAEITRRIVEITDAQDELLELTERLLGKFEQLQAEAERLAMEFQGGVNDNPRPLRKPLPVRRRL